jgi:hypothetical protein
MQLQGPEEHNTYVALWRGRAHNANTVAHTLRIIFKRGECSGHDDEHSSYEEKSNPLDALAKKEREGGGNLYILVDKQRLEPHAPTPVPSEAVNEQPAEEVARKRNHVDNKIAESDSLQSASGTAVVAESDVRQNLACKEPLAVVRNVKNKPATAVQNGGVKRNTVNSHMRKLIHASDCGNIRSIL